MTISAMKQRFRDAHKPMVSVHRGLWAEAPENSCSAIQKAAMFDVVEVDVRLDQTGRAYFIHDDTLLRTTGVDGPATGADPHTLVNLKLLDGAGGPGARATSDPVPWLSNGFAALDGSDAIFDLDVKRPQDLSAVAREVAALGETHRATLKAKVTNAADIRALRDLEDAYGVMVMAKVQLKDRAALDILRALKAADVAAAEVKYASLDLLEQGCAAGGADLRLSVLTLDIVHNCDLSDSAALQHPGAVWGRLIDAGAGLIMTDQPQALSDWIATGQTKARRA